MILFDDETIRFELDEYKPRFQQMIVSRYGLLGCPILSVSRIAKEAHCAPARVKVHIAAMLKEIRENMDGTTDRKIRACERREEKRQKEQQRNEKIWAKSPFLRPFQPKDFSPIGSELVYRFRQGGVPLKTLGDLAQLSDGITFVMESTYNGTHILTSRMLPVIARGLAKYGIPFRVIEDPRDLKKPANIIARWQCFLDTAEGAAA